MRALAERAACPPEAAALAELAGEAAYRDRIAAPKTSLVDLLARFPSAAVGLTLQDFVNAAPRLTPRYYSIASSPAAAGGATRVAACVGKMIWLVTSSPPFLGGMESRSWRLAIRRNKTQLVPPSPLSLTLFYSLRPRRVRHRVR